jgi:hypothetical protein
MKFIFLFNFNFRRPKKQNKHPTCRCRDRLPFMRDDAMNHELTKLNQDNYTIYLDYEVSR